MTSLFGTDGIRGTVGTGFFTEQQLIQCGKAVGMWLQQKHAQPHLLLTYDTRISASFIKVCLMTGLAQTGVTVHDAGVLPTAGLFHLLPNSIYHLGIMITASHNPYYDNGIKIVTPHGKLSAEEEATFMHFFSSELTATHYAQMHTVTDAPEQYKNHLRAGFPNLKLNGIKIVVDTAHGAFYSIAPQLLTELGATVIPLHTEPNGSNINEKCGSVHPQALIAAVRKHSAMLGCAFDGDGDRIVLVGPDGTLKDGDDILAYLLQHPDYVNTPALVGTVMSNAGLAHWCQQNNKQLVRTQVGDKYVIEQLQKNNLLLGGEPSGHIILNNHLSTGDGLLVLLKVLETLLLTKNYTFTTFAKYPQALTNIRIQQKKDLTLSPCKEVINAAEQEVLDGRVLVRYSGTENVLRVMVEAPEEILARTLCTRLTQQLDTLLQ